MRIKEKEGKRSLKENEKKENCLHYWSIETSQGPTSRGVCKICGAQKEFLNFVPEPVPPVKKGGNPMDLPPIGNIDFDEEENSS